MPLSVSKEGTSEVASEPFAVGAVSECLSAALFEAKACSCRERGNGCEEAAGRMPTLTPGKKNKKSECTVLSSDQRHRSPPANEAGR